MCDRNKIAKFVTSAVQGMSVSDMRKYLSETRSMVDSQTVDLPFSLCKMLSNNMCVSNFVVQVACGIHQKRSKKPCPKIKTT